MKELRTILLALVAVAALGKAVSMLPPDVFKDPIFASSDSSDDSGSDSGYSEFA